MHSKSWALAAFFALAISLLMPFVKPGAGAAQPAKEIAFAALR